MNILVTTHSLVNAPYLNHLHYSGQSKVFNLTLNDKIHAILSSTVVINSPSQFYFHKNSIFGICNKLDACYSAEEHVQLLVEDYILYGLPNKYKIGSFGCQPCVLLDGITETLWLFADSIGSIPLWYEFPERRESAPQFDFVVSSDLFAARHLGFSHLTPLGAGQSLSVDLRTNEILSMDHWLPPFVRNVSAESPAVDSEHFAKSLLSAAMSAAHRTIANHSTEEDIQFATEFDETHTSSLLLECASDAMAVSRAVRISRALVADVVLDQSASASLLLLIGMCRLLITGVH